MTLYGNFGDQLNIVANCGEHKPDGFLYPVRLVKVDFGNGMIRYRFAEFLRADKGWPEIAAELESAPVEMLEGKELQKALQQAM